MVLAHIGHWWAEMLYVAPVLVMGGWLLVSGRRERRRSASVPSSPRQRG